jgi:hypothetical protein
VSHVLFLTLGAMFTGFSLRVFSLAVSHVNDKLVPSELVAASSSLLLLNGAGAAVGPVLAGSLIGRFGPDAYYMTLGSLTGMLTLYDLWRKMRQRAPETKRPYVNAHPS